MKIFVTALAAAGLVLSSGAAFAQATGSLGVGTGFEDVDTDNNGMVSWAEFSLVFTDITEEQFNMADADGDGFLNAAEFDTIALQTGSVAPRHEQVDPVPLQSTIEQD